MGQRVKPEETREELPEKYGSMEPKKLSLLRIKEILEQHSDREHPLKQEEIIQYLDRDYGISLDRKAVSRNISFLQEAGMEIQTGQGCYLKKRLFDDSELRLLIDAVLSGRHITEKRSKELIRKLQSLSSEYFRAHIRHVDHVGDFNKTENPALFLNIDLIDSAISRGRQIRYEYNRYGMDKKLHHSSTSVISPYQMILHNQRYYVMGYSEYWGNMVFHRMDRITNLTVEETKAVPVRSLRGYENGINYKSLACAMPYMYTDTPEYIEILADTGIIDQIIDWFGKDIVIQKYSEKQVRVRLKSSPLAMEHWALQYLCHVEVLRPESLRAKIREDLETQKEKYRN